jgi:hypothetical protein
MADSMQNGNNNMSDIFQSGNLNKATTINHVYMSTVAQMEMETWLWLLNLTKDRFTLNNI